jgi:hypothetical protein
MDPLGNMLEKTGLKTYRDLQTLGLHHGYRYADGKIHNNF